MSYAIAPGVSMETKRRKLAEMRAVPFWIKQYFTQQGFKAGVNYCMRNKVSQRKAYAEGLSAGFKRGRAYGYGEASFEKSVFRPSKRRKRR